MPEPALEKEATAQQPQSQLPASGAPSQLPISPLSYHRSRSKKIFNILLIALGVITIVFLVQNVKLGRLPIAEVSSTPLPYPTPPPEVATLFPDGFPKDIPWLRGFGLQESLEILYVLPESKKVRIILVNMESSDAKIALEAFRRYYAYKAFLIHERQTGAHADGIASFAARRLDASNQELAVAYVSLDDGDIRIREELMIAPEESLLIPLLRDVVPEGFPLPASEDAYIERYETVSLTANSKSYATTFKINQPLMRAVGMYEAFLKENEYAVTVNAPPGAKEQIQYLEAKASTREISIFFEGGIPEEWVTNIHAVISVSN